jgi:hypothetical protein
MVKPITPSEAKANAVSNIPDVVFEVVNELIVKGIGSNNHVTIKQDDIMAHIVERVKPEDGQAYRQTVYDNHWLDFESAYEKAGWSVTYDKPAYCESYPATFKFSRKSR